tara:strand:- start:2487 stop:2906 length:420 start_codon:yes stop_codon:yes gene_type:complete
MIKEKPILEWRLQAAAVKRLKHTPEYLAGRFLFAGDQNAGKRGPQAATIAKATGLAPGDPDMRIYLGGGVLRMIELKRKGGVLTPAQKIRIPALRALGHTVEIVERETEDEMADAIEALVMRWLKMQAANENTVAKKTG